MYYNKELQERMGELFERKNAASESTKKERSTDRPLGTQGWSTRH
jgi:hypothetical protein